MQSAGDSLEFLSFSVVKIKINFNLNDEVSKNLMKKFNIKANRLELCFEYNSQCLNVNKN